MDVSAAARAIKRGELVGVPTDTVYGLAADPYDEAALERICNHSGLTRRIVAGLYIKLCRLDQFGPIFVDH